MILLDLPNDLILEILQHLLVIDLLSVKQTCRALHALGGTDYVWHQLMSKFRLPIDLPISVSITSAPAAQLQLLAIKAMRLESNWRRRTPQVKNVTALLQGSDGAYVDGMGITPGGRWLWTTQRGEMRGRTVYTRVSLWSLEDIKHPRCVWSESIRGRIRTCTLEIDERHDCAAIHLGIFDSDLHEVLSTHRIALREYTLSSGPGPTELSVKLHPSMSATPPIVYEVTPYKGLLFVTVFVPGATLGFLQLQLVDPASGLRIWIDRRVGQSFRSRRVRARDGFLYLVGETGDEVMLEVYRLAPVIHSPLDLDAISCMIVDSHFLDLGPPVATHTGIARSASSPASYDIANVSHISPAGLSCAVRDAHASWKDRMIRIVRFPLTGAGAVTRTDLPISSRDASVELVQVGAHGRRAVWLEHNLDTRQKRVIRMSFDPHADAAQTGVLFPANPELPFSPTKCHAMAFDEVSGRLCMAIYDGNLYVVDFV